MDWTQIEINWAAMTRRIRSDRNHGSGTKEAIRGTFPEALPWSGTATARGPFETLADTAHELGNS